MKIVVLDGKTLNSGDLSWKGFQSLGECTVYDSSPAETVLERSQGAAALITNKTVLDKSIIDALPDLRYIGVLATGYNVVDIAAARSRNIPVTNVPKYGSTAVAQCTFAHLLNLTFHLNIHTEAVRQGDWAKCRDFCFWNAPLVELAGKTLGLIGFGEIGRAVARIAQAFPMQVLAFDPTLPQSGERDGVRLVPLPQLLAESDAVSLHCPLTDSNREMVNSSFLSQMKPSAFLINTARGLLVNESDLAVALNQGRIAGAGFDVLSVEPPDPANPLLSAKNCYITPHIAWAPLESRARLMRTAVENFQDFLAGKPKNVVN